MTDQNLDAQRDLLAKAGCDVIREERKSGKGRKELQTLRDFMREGDTLVATKLDKLARSTIDTLTLIQELHYRGIKSRSAARQSS